MRIDGTNKIGQGSPDPLDNQPRSSGLPRNTPTEQSPAVEQHLKPLIEKVKRAENVDFQAVAEAKQLLDSGKLDSPEAILRAAEALLRFGI